MARRERKGDRDHDEKSEERKFKRIGCAFINGSSYKIGPGLWRIKDTGFGFSISLKTVRVHW